MSLALVAIATVRSLFAGGDAVVVDEAGRGPYAVARASVNIAVGRTMSHVVGEFHYVYVRDFDSEDRLDPVLIDVPVIVRAEDTHPGKLLKLANARLVIGRRTYQPRTALVLDHEAYEPVPWLPDGARIALISFNIPRKGLKPRFRAHLAYDQPHVSGVDGAQLTGFVPLLPDYEPLDQVLHFKADDFRVTFTALPEVILHRDSVNAHVVSETPGELVVQPRNRESILVVIEET